MPSQPLHHREELKLHNFTKLILCSVGGLALPLFTNTLALAGCSDYPAAGVDWSGCRKRNIMMSEGDFSGANFKNIDMVASDLRKGNFERVNFERAIMTRVDGSQANMNNANLAKAESSRAKFIQTQFNSASFEKSVFFRGDFTAADMSKANLHKSEFSRTNFQSAILTDATVTFANIARANFRETTLVNTDFTSSWTFLTRFEGVNLSAAKGLTQGQIDIACGDDKTLLPTGLAAPASWPCGDDN